MRRKRGLTFKLMAGGVSIAVIPLLVVGLFAVNQASRGLKEAAQEQSVRLAGNLAEMIQLVLEEEKKLAKKLASGGMLL
jgi:methyl-accepting chemotaxis protein